MITLTLNESVIPIRKVVRIDYRTGDTFLIAEDFSYYLITWKPDPNTVQVDKVILTENHTSTTYWMQDVDYFPWYLMDHCRSVELDDDRTVDFYRVAPLYNRREALIVVMGDKLLNYAIPGHGSTCYGESWENSIIAKVA